MSVCFIVVQLLSLVLLFSSPWTVACQALLSMRFSRQEYWSGLPCPSPGDLLSLGIKPWSPTLEADSLQSEPPGNSWLFLSIMEGNKWEWT